MESSEQSPSHQELPPFTIRNVLLDIFNGVRAAITDPAANRFAAMLVIFLSSIACKVIIKKVNYTEIDFSTYMQQIEMVNEGALDYEIIGGDTGPIVYPAGFVQVYQALHWLTDGGADLEIAQFAFGYLFTATTLLTAVVYVSSGVPPWTIYLLLMSKRLYSIYVLRMFNDCFTTIGIVAVVMLLQQVAYWSNVLSDTMKFLLCAVAADIFSLALSVKMNVLLYLPAFIFVVYFLLGERVHHLAVVLLIIPAVQVLVGWRFLLPLFWDEEACRLRNNYLSLAFDFSRKFMFKWTVNWRFVPEEIFLSDAFSTLLLVGHVSVLLLFLFSRFASKRIIGKLVYDLISDALKRPFSKTLNKKNLLLSPNQGPKLILLIFSVTNLVGILFARSLHYQFLSWYCWLLPFLLHAAGFNALFGPLVFLAHEWCWNVYPSTNSSSQLLILIFVILLFAVWNNRKFWFSEDFEAEFDSKPKTD